MLQLLTRLARLRRQPLAPRDAYALWAETYSPRSHDPLMEAEQAVVAPILATTTPRRALDVGTGTGRYVPLLFSAGARTVVGVDISLAMLGRQERVVPRVCGDACRLPFSDGSFDLVCCSLMVGDVEDLSVWVREATRVLAPCGHLVYSDFHPSWATRRWRRTFLTAKGRRIELSYFPHTIEEHLAVLSKAAVIVRTIREPRAVGQMDPVVVVFHAVKRGMAANRSLHRPGLV
jgi:malonyl-CoA O-methyltransferase